jgi:ubiquinone/menaquinone biosynthesis C-methylase UbiE
VERELEPEVMDDAAEAAAYDAMDHGEPNRAFVERLVALGARGWTLDIGTGPGRLPLQVCDRVPGARILGVDLSESMLRLARARLAGSPQALRIEYRRADAKALPLPDARFDTVYSNTLLHHIPDPAPFLAEARRVLQPGGTLLIRDLYRPPTPARALELVARHAGDATPEQRGLLRASLHAALTPGELRELADAVDLADAELVVDSDRHMSLQRRGTPA